MGQDERYTIPMSGALTNEMDVDVIKLGAEMMNGVQLALLCAPIELVGPICTQLFEVINVSPLGPCSAYGVIGRGRVAATLAKIGQDLLVNVDRERSDVWG